MGVIERLLADVGERGSALLIRGDPGIGKSSILAEAKSLATDRGMSVLSATGVESETNVPFTGLYELLRPILSRSDRLPGPQQNALRAAFGLAEGPTADLFLFALGALNLLADFASERALLLVVDDVHWFDPSSMYVLGFIARRLESDPVVLLIAGRNTPETPLAQVVPELGIEALNDKAARALLDMLYPDLRPGYRRRVLEESAGNPLALVEFPKAIERERGAGKMLPSVLPLTTRLERVFAERIAGVPASTRSLLLIAALCEGDSVAEVISAAKLLDGVDASLAALTPAVTAELLDVDTTKLSFRHPLVRSAVYDASSLAERVAAHAALATASTDPDARAWHRAAATVGLDDAVAADLESAAIRAEQRGDVRGAIRKLDRAARISGGMTRTARCLLKAAELAYEIGWQTIVVGLLERAQKLDLSPRDRLRLKFYCAATTETISSAQALVEIADSIRSEEDVDLALDLFTRVAVAGWWAETDEQVSNYVISAIESAHVSLQDDPRFLFVVASAAPIDRGAFVIDRARILESKFNGDTESMACLIAAAFVVGDFQRVESLLDRTVAALRSEGRLPQLARILHFRARIAMYLANADVALPDAEEAERLAHETGQPMWVAQAQTVRAVFAALRGEHELAEAQAASAEQASRSIGSPFAYVQMARGLDALSSGRYDDAYRNFRRMFDPADAAYSPMRHCFCIGDLAEAAVQSGHGDEARAILAQMQMLSERTPSPQFHAAMYHARAILADDTAAERLFQEALAADIVRSPFLRARLQLAFGTWLRRARRVKEARSLLQAAVEQFDRLSFAPWSERARQELRNAGVVPQRRVPDRREQLTPQELQIARMAAEGLSNQEIGQKLFLSRRTVGSHLYRLFPKLQITSRYQLRDVLS
jgi:DNA-binding CsgD family transcriptional regulator